MYRGAWSLYSSRRRHTRYWRDWSSDVCSSDREALHGGPGFDQGAVHGEVLGGQQTLHPGLTQNGGQELGGNVALEQAVAALGEGDRKSTRLNSTHANISYAVFCLKKKNEENRESTRE